MLGIVGVILSLGLLMYLAYRGINVLVLAPLLALLAVVFSGFEMPLLATYTQVFMTSLGGYLMRFFPLFMLGAIFGKLMDDSGSAKTIAHVIVDKVGRERAILAVVLACGILTYGGVSLFVVAFGVYPIAASLFREANVPKRLIPGAIALGSFTFTMTAFPGTPAIQNAIPMPYFGTDPFAAPGLGTIGGLVMLVGGMLWLNRRFAIARGRGEGYGTHRDTPTEAQAAAAAAAPGHAGPSFLASMVPIVLVILLNYLFTKFVIPQMETAYLAEPRYGKTDLNAVRGNWAIIAALFLAILALVAMHWKRWTNVKESVNSGTMGSLLPIFNTASEVGYGTVISSLAAFVVLRDAVVGISGNPLISEAIAINVLAGVTGSASGGMSIALQTLGKTYLEMGQAAGIDPELLHRIASMASGGFDSLPHNGAVITLLAICGLTHRESYADIGVCTVLVPVIAQVVVIVLGTAVGSF